MRARALEWCRLRPTLRVGVRELLILAGLFSMYKAARLFARDADLVAVANAWRLLEWQQLLFLPREQTLQGLMLTSEAVTSGANSYYAWVHFPALTGLAMGVQSRSPSPRRGCWPRQDSSTPPPSRTDRVRQPWRRQHLQSVRRDAQPALRVVAGGGGRHGTRGWFEVAVGLVRASPVHARGDRGNRQPLLARRGRGGAAPHGSRAGRTCVLRAGIEPSRRAAAAGVATRGPRPGCGPGLGDRIPRPSCVVDMRAAGGCPVAGSNMCGP